VTWFDDTALVRQLPAAFRAYAAYARLAVDRRSGRVRGGSFAHRMLARAVSAAGLRRVSPVRLNGLTVHLDLCDPRMFWVIGEVGGQSPEARIIGELLAPGDTFLDIGANHGSYSLLAARRVGAGGAVLAFEPQPLLAELIRRSFAANGFSHGRVEQVALADRGGWTRLFVPRTNSGAASVHEALSPSRGASVIDVELVSLDDRLLERPPLPGRILVKLDVEGAELAVLRGARALLSRRRPPLIVEISPATMRAAGHGLQELLDVLLASGYSRYAELDSFPAARPLPSLGAHPQRNVVVLS
jgi:FkbM family methyltransferase